VTNTEPVIHGSLKERKPAGQCLTGRRRRSRALLKNELKGEFYRGGKKRKRFSPNLCYGHPWDGTEPTARKGYLNREEEKGSAARCFFLFYRRQKKGKGRSKKEGGGPLAIFLKKKRKKRRKNAGVFSPAAKIAGNRVGTGEKGSRECCLLGPRRKETGNASSFVRFVPFITDRSSQKITASRGKERDALLSALSLGGEGGERSRERNRMNSSLKKKRITGQEKTILLLSASGRIKKG